MPRTKNISISELRKHLPTKPYLLFFVLLLLTLLMISRETYGSEPENVKVDRYHLDIIEEEVFVFRIKSVLEYVSVECKPLGPGNSFDLLVYKIQRERMTLVSVQPKAQGTYNLTIAFQNNETSDYELGVYPGNWIIGATRLLGNWTINVVLDCHGSITQSSSPIFFIEAPTPVNFMLIITTAGLTAYINAFLILDTYFKNKKDLVSRKRWLLIGVAVIISGLAIYHLAS